VASRLVIDTLTITAAPVPLAMSVSPTSRSTTAQVGTAAAGDSATVTLTGDNSISTAWSASKKKAWTTLTAGSGTGSGKVKWTRSTGGLSAGTYVDTITVTAPGVASRLVIDTLTITVAPVPLAMSVSPTSRSTTAQVGTAAAGDSATVTITGDGSTAKVWSATKKKAWTTLTAASGTGSGKVKWNRSTSGLAAGTYVDTITVSASGLASRLVIDTLTITAAPVPLAMSVSPTSRAKSAVAGTAVGGDSATVTLTGDGSTTKVWSATKKKAWTTLIVASGTGSGKVKWNRSTSGLAAGTYVDTITVSASGLTPRLVIDTLTISPAPIPLTITAAVTGRRRTFVQGSGTNSYDTVMVTVAGTGASTAAWSGSKLAWRTQILTPTGQGSAAYVWRVALASATPGLYTDLHTIALTGVPGGTITIADTVEVVPAPVPLALAVAPLSRLASAQVGTAATGDSAAVTLTGDNSSTTAWSAAKKKPWTTLTASSGSGSGTVRWSRNTNGLVAGTYVDTITVSASGLSPRTIIDTLLITSAPPPLALALTPGGLKVTVPQGAIAPAASAVVALSGTGSTTATWSASKQKGWTTLTTATGTGSGVVAWTRATQALPAGTHVDTITVAVAGLAPKVVMDTIVVTPSTPITVALLAGASRVTAVEGSTQLLEDEAGIELGGSGASGTTWFATNRRASTTIVTNTGIGNGTLRWRRNPTGLTVGHHVDTLTVIAGGATAFLVDTLTITSGTVTPPPTPPAPIVATVAPASRLIVVPQQNGWAPDSAALQLSGTGAASANWTVVARKAHTSILNASGTGPATIQWRRRLNGLAPGTYVDTLTVTVTTLSAHVIIDSLIILPQTTANLSKRGGRTKVMESGRGRAAATGADTTSVIVSTIGDTGGGNQPAQWVATTTAPWIRITNGLTPTTDPIQWERQLDLLPLGRHIDSVVVTLSSNPSLRGAYVDTVDVVQVAEPTPTVAVEDLVRGGKLNVDQRDLFDAIGNRNGRFDLGDFLAWVDRNQIALTGAMMQSVVEVQARETAARARRAQAIERPDSLP
jgi:hypothetical protein